MNMEFAYAYDYPWEVKELFTEYTEALIASDPNFKEYLNQQNYDMEIKHLQMKYGMPEGRLYIATLDDEIAGCVAMKKAAEGVAELKRLYVRPEYRGNGLGDFMVKRIIADAKEVGYNQLRLDTLPFLKNAYEIYVANGFEEVEAYNDNPMGNSIYMAINLK